jgi:hypothetical protein
MEIRRSFTMPFKDPDWLKKMGLGGLWLLLWVTGPAALGAMLAYIRSVAHGNETLPEWSDFRTKWIEGFLVQLGIVIYIIPVFLLQAIAFSAFEAGGERTIWITLSLAVMWLIAVAVFAYGAVVNYAVKGYFSDLFAVANIQQAIRSRSGYFGALGTSLVIVFLSYIIGSILFASLLVNGGILVLTVVGLVLLPWLIFVSWMIMGHMFGQYAAKAYGLPGLVAVPRGARKP